MTLRIARPSRRLFVVVRIFLAAFAACLVLVPSGSSTAQAAPATTVTSAVVEGIHLPGIDPCALIFNPIVKKGCEATVGNVHVSVPVLPTPTNIAADVANTIVPGIMSQFMGQIASWVADGLQGMLSWINHTTIPDLTLDWSIKLAAMTLGYASLIAVAAFGARGVKAASDQDANEAVKGFFHLGLFVGMAPTIPFIVTWFVKVCDDQVAGGLIKQFGNNMQQTMVQLVQTLGSQGDWTSAGGAVMFLGLFGVAGTAILAVEFFIREAAIFLYTYYVILCAGMAIFGDWQLDRLKRAIVALIGLCLFKVFVVVIMIIGVMLLGDPSHDAQAIIYGSVILLMVPVMSWWMYKKFSGHDANATNVYLRTKAAASVAKSALTRGAA